MNVSRILASTLMAATVLGGAVAAHAADVLNFGIISTESSQNLKSVWMPFLKDMSKKMGVEVKPFFASDYAGVIEGMRFNKVDVAWIGNKGAMEMVDRAGGEVFAQTVAADGSMGYYSYIIAPKDSPINSLEDMFKDAKNLSFGNGDPNSTSGFLVPSYYVFAKNNADPKKIFKRMLTSNHEANAMSVATKQLDVATCNSESMDRLKVTHPDKEKMIKVIWKSPLIPGDPIVLRKNLDKATRDKIKNFFLTYGVKGDNMEEEKAHLKLLSWSPFKASTNDQLIPIRQLELFRNKTKVQADPNLSESEKAAKVAEFDKQLKQLGAN